MGGLGATILIPVYTSVEQTTNLVAMNTTHQDWTGLPVMKI
jgi:hypothetical protein